MIQLVPNRTYKLHYLDGKTYEEGTVKYFRTLNDVPEAKHLIEVRDLSTGEIVKLVDLLSHPWDRLIEYTGILPSELINKGWDLLKATIPLLISVKGFITRIRLKEHRVIVIQ